MTTLSSEQGSEIWFEDVFNHTPGTSWDPTTGAFGGFVPNYLGVADYLGSGAAGFSDFTGNEFRSTDMMHFSIDVKSGSTTALGWYAVEGAGPGYFTFSKFEVTAFNGATVVDTFEFIPASFNTGAPVGNVFFGITSTNPFTSLRFRELTNDPLNVTPDSPIYQVGDPEPEFFGNFVFATVASPVPEASTSLSLLVGSMLLMARRKRA